jgi:methyl-accepting chemotaxis protein
MFKGLSLSGKLYLGFASVLLIAGALGIFAYSRLAEIDTDANHIAHEKLPAIANIGKAHVLVGRNLSLAGKHVLATDPSDMAKVAAEFADTRDKITALVEEYEKTITHPKDRELFERFKALRKEYVSCLANELIPVSKAGKKEEAKAILDGKFGAAYNQFNEGIAALVEYNIESGKESGAEILNATSHAKSGILFGLLAALAAGAAIGIFLSKSISSALNQVIASLSSGSEQVSSASNQVSQSSQQMAEGASQQASSLEETSASLEEMSSMTRQNSDNAKQANLMATETRSAVEKSREAMSRMGDAIGKIKGSSDQTAKIIKTIDEIAFQTNLLALNAAVEAARAGDAGKGFAVVAEEVRNLAQRSAEAAKNTAALIEESQQNANNGVAVSNEVGGILTGIVDSVQKLSQLIGEVSSASQEQTKGIEQIGTAVTEMDKLTQANAANAEESASASEELFAQAKELSEMVSALVGIVKGGGAAGSAAGLPGSHGGQRSLGRQPAAPKAARKASASKARAGSGGSQGNDWSPEGVRSPAFHVAGANGKALKPEQAIPMDDNDMKDF